MTDFHAIIPAGGAGTRLWPLSRQSAPKFLTDLTGAGRTLLQATIHRLSPVAKSCLVVTGSAHAVAVGEQVPQADVMVEPSARGTMGAIGLAAAVLQQRYGDVVVGSFAADHLIRDEDAFHRAVRSALEAAENGYVVTIGITPDEPSTAYGYIRAAAAMGESAQSVLAFVEKPDVETATRYLASGEYFWNAGMFIAKASVLLQALEHFHPEMARPIDELAKAWDTPERTAAIERYWEDLPAAVIDRAIAEPLAAEGGVAVVPAEMGWSDVGDYSSLAAVIAPAELSHGVVPGGEPQRTFISDSPGALVYAGSKPIVVAGVPGAVVVEAADVIFVTQQSAAQEVKRIVDGLDDAGLGYLH
ncbi:mannose-1-phosphate guanylyltransferase [Actinobaculum sp. 313]|uniref:mannose-1-phosphate guanylyltransferase n=1 Tax=Actinobaculum sp. 313 TaxID=2495645 RepID=UPI000D5263AF|nr:mannose-1-phosphate guanylyltransferase [Actinobaculum sp. 313]AWE42131.1 mannose-1-phosphate guanylyltransferase [Actinobaculum sp. 313]